MKSTTDVCGTEHLKDEPKIADHWSGIGNYQVRDGMKMGKPVIDHADRK